jgi:hypothetical protein
MPADRKVLAGTTIKAPVRKAAESKKGKYRQSCARYHLHL